MSMYTQLSTTEILELANNFCPAFSQEKYQIGAVPVEPSSIELEGRYWFVSIESHSSFPKVAVDLVIVQSISTTIVKGKSDISGSEVQYPLSSVTIFPVVRRQAYIPRESILLKADEELELAFHEGRLPEDLVYGIGVLNGVESKSRQQPYTTGSTWGYGMFYTFKRCTGHSLSKDDWFVWAGEQADYRQYGLDKRRRVRRFDGGSYGKCLGFTYMDAPMPVQSWEVYKSWNTETTPVNVFSIHHQVEYDAQVTQYMRWIKEYTKSRQGAIPIYDSLNDVPMNILNPPASKRIQRIWLMVYGNDNISSVLPIDITTGEYRSVGERIALYQIERSEGRSVDDTTCSICNYSYIPVENEMVCRTCTNIKELSRTLPVEMQEWVQSLRTDGHLEVEKVQTMANASHWTVSLPHRFGKSISIPKTADFIEDAVDGVRAYRWQKDNRVLYIRCCVTIRESLDVFGELGAVTDRNVEETIVQMELCSVPAEMNCPFDSVMTPSLFGLYE